MEQLPLLPERFLLFADVGSSHLEGHILICDFGDVRNKEDTRKTENEDTDGQVHPLDTQQGGHCITCPCEENVRAQYRTNDGADSIEGLGEIDTDFSVARWTADCTAISKTMARWFDRNGRLINTYPSGKDWQLSRASPTRNQ